MFFITKFTLPNKCLFHLFNFKPATMNSTIFIRNIQLVLIPLLISHIVMAKDKDFAYLRDGISFSLSDGWKTIANDSIGDKAYYFSAERTGTHSTGLITITWVNKIEDPAKMIEIHQQSMKSSNIFRNPGIEFSAIENDTFASLKVKSCHYITFVKDQKLEGIIYCFNSSNKTITIFLQSGLNDNKLNQKAFELLRNTFNCRD